MASLGFRGPIRVSVLEEKPMNIISMLGGAFFTTLLGEVKQVALAYVNKEIKDSEFDARIKEAVLKSGEQLAHVQGDVIKKELDTDSWLTKNWRPLMMAWAAVLITIFVYVEPFMVNRLGLAPLQTSDTLLLGVLEILKWGVSGYIAGRTAEKVASKIKG